MSTLREVRARFARDQELPFADALTETSILDALNEHDFKYCGRLFGPVTTISGFGGSVATGTECACFGPLAFNHSTPMNSWPTRSRRRWVGNADSLSELGRPLDGC
jgi:hypothetical protein